jgi:hypothetical protein
LDCVEEQGEIVVVLIVVVAVVMAVVVCGEKVMGGG